MKSKAHFKKCSELGISPIPTMPDDDVNDFDDSASDMHRNSMNGRENDSRGDSETEDNDSDDDMDDESGDGKNTERFVMEHKIFNNFNNPQIRMSRRAECQSTKQPNFFFHSRIMQRQRRRVSFR